MDGSGDGVGDFGGLVRRIDYLEFSESDDVGRSLPRDRKQSAKRESKSGHGDRGDRKKK